MKRELPDKAFEYISEVLDSGLYSSRYGEMTHRFERAFAEKKGVNFAVAVNSGTSALFVALKACGIGLGDEVIVPCLGPTMTAAAVVHCGATPVFADIDPETYCLNISELFINHFYRDEIKAVIPVHIFGNECDANKLDRYLHIIEDCAQAVNLGGHGDISCYSFEQSKHICCGDGGMATTNDPEIAREMRQWSDGGVSCVTASDGRWKGGAWFDNMVGYNLRMPELSAAVGLAQFEDNPPCDIPGCRCGVKKHEPMHFTKHVPDNPNKFEQALIDFGVEFSRAPWDKLVYQHGIFGNQKGLCPAAEKINPNLIVFPVKEKETVERVERYVGISS